MAKERAAYYKARSKKVINFVVDDDELKSRLKEAALADGRTVNGWIKHYILPKIAADIDEQLKKKASSKRK